MATIAARPDITVHAPARGRRYDHWFFSGIAALILVTVFIGFAPTYFLAGVFHAPLPALIIHIHGALFSCWILLLIVQTSLVSAHRVDWHRRLGLFGFCLACLMPVVGVLAASNMLGRNMSPPGVDPKVFYAVPLGDMLNFTVLVFFAFRARSNPSAHKRLTLIATVALLTAAFARFHISFLWDKPLPFRAVLVSYSFLLALFLYDLWSLRKIHPATLWGSLLVVFVDFVRLPLAHTAAWQNFASWVQKLSQ